MRHQWWYHYLYYLSFILYLHFEFYLQYSNFENCFQLNWKNLITSLYHDNESIRKRFISGELKIFVEDEIYLKKVVEFLSKLHSRLLCK